MPTPAPEKLSSDSSSRIHNPRKGESSVWKELKPFSGNVKTNNSSGGKKEYYQWDYTHNDIEVYDSKGFPKGSMNPSTGQIYKPAVKGRKLWD